MRTLQPTFDRTAGLLISTTRRDLSGTAACKRPRAVPRAAEMGPGASHPEGRQILSKKEWIPLIFPRGSRKLRQTPPKPPKPLPRQTGNPIRKTKQSKGSG